MQKIRARKAFEFIEYDVKRLVGYQHIAMHFVFDIKLGENFRRKARLVAYRNKTKVPSSVTYSSVVGRDSVRICLILVVLNGLDIKGADFENAYLSAPCREKILVEAGPEFGSDAGKPFKIVKTLYGLKSSGATFHQHLVEQLDDIGFK